MFNDVTCFVVMKPI